MANRACPVCGKQVPATLEMAYTNGLECPHCHSRLDVVSSSRMVPIWAGLVAAYLVYRISSGISGPVGFVLPELFAVLAFGVVTPLLLAVTARLEQALEPPPIPTAQAHAPSHGGHTH